MIAGVLGRAGEEGQRKRLEAAEAGEVTWLPPVGLGKPDSEEWRAGQESGNGKRTVKTNEQDDDVLVDSIKKKAKFTSFDEEGL